MIYFDFQFLSANTIAKFIIRSIRKDTARSPLLLNFETDSELVSPLSRDEFFENLNLHFAKVAIHHLRSTNCRVRTFTYDSTPAVLRGDLNLWICPLPTISTYFTPPVEYSWVVWINIIIFINSSFKHPFCISISKKIAIATSISRTVSIEENTEWSPQKVSYDI